VWGVVQGQGDDNNMLHLPDSPPPVLTIPSGSGVRTFPLKRGTFAILP